MKVRLAVVFLFGVCSSVAIPADAPTPSAAQCTVALQVTKSLVSTADFPLVFTTKDEAEGTSGGVYQITGGRWIRRFSDKVLEVSAPPKDLTDQLGAGIRNAVGRCPNIQRWLTAKRIGYGSKAVDAVVNASSGDDLSAGIYSVSLPVISANGRQAVIYYSSVFGGEAGGGHAIFLEVQPSGKWEEVATTRIWVS